MIASGMAAAAVVSVLLAAAAWCAARVAGLAGAPRRWAWLAGMTLCVAIPTGAALRPRADLRSTATPFTADAEVSTTPGSSSAAVWGDTAADSLLLASWCLLSLGLTVFFGVVHRRTVAHVASGGTRDLLGRPVSVTRDFGPAVVGAGRGRIVLPEWVFELSLDDQRLILAHEQAHVDAADQLVFLAGLGMTVLMPWNPALWWQLRRLKVAIEVDCDARVVAAQRDRPRYGELLLRLGTQRTTIQSALALASRSSALVERLHVLLEARRPSWPRRASYTAGAVACLAGVMQVPLPGFLNPASRRAAPAAIVPDSSRALPPRTAPMTRATRVSDPPYATSRGVRVPLPGPAPQSTGPVRGVRVSVPPAGPAPESPGAARAVRVHFPSTDSASGRP